MKSEKHRDGRPKAKQASVSKLPSASQLSNIKGHTKYGYTLYVQIIIITAPCTQDSYRRVGRTAQPAKALQRLLARVKLFKLQLKYFAFPAGGEGEVEAGAREGCHTLLCPRSEDNAGLFHTV